MMIGTSEYREDLQFLSTKEYLWDSLTGQNVLVTGCTGAIGSLLSDVLIAKSKEYGFSVSVVSRNMDKMKRMFDVHEGAVELIAHDMNEPLEGRKFDTIFHCASNTHPAQYSDDPIGTLLTNTLGLKNALDLMSPESRGRFIFISSVEIYGQNRGDVEKFKEDYCGHIDCNTVRACYNEGKRAGEALCQAYGKQKGIDFVIPRLCRIYGPTTNLGDTKASTQFIMNGVRGENITLKSEGKQSFSYCYATDAVDAIVFLFFNGVSKEAYNVAGLNSDITLKGLAEHVASISKTELIFDIPDDYGKDGYSVSTKALLDTNKIERLGWHPHYTLDAGLRRTIDSIRHQIGGL